MQNGAIVGVFFFARGNQKKGVTRTEIRPRILLRAADSLLLSPFPSVNGSFSGRFPSSWNQLVFYERVEWTAVFSLTLVAESSFLFLPPCSEPGRRVVSAGLFPASRFVTWGQVLVNL